MLQFERCTVGVAVYTSLLVTQCVLVTVLLVTVSALRTLICAADGIGCHRNLLGSTLHLVLGCNRPVAWKCSVPRFGAISAANQNWLQPTQCFMQCKNSQQRAKNIYDP